MKKIIFIALFLCSCRENYDYVVAIECCNGKKDTIEFRGNDYKIDNYHYAVPELIVDNSSSIKINVCEAKTLSKTEVK